MRHLSLFNFTTLNGHFKGPGGDISWHKHGEEESRYSEKALALDSTLLFGRITYEIMASYWPTPEAYESSPIVADGMNKSEKIVFSRTLISASWNNTRIISDNIVDEIRKMKRMPGKDMAILGSGSIAALLADYRLIDRYQIMIDPVAIGIGTPIFNGIKKPLQLKLIRSKTFKSGVVLLDYVPL